MNSDQIRESFLRFFESKGHKVMPSSSLVPQGDPTLLFTSAGMVQFKPYYLGEQVPPNPRLASCQKCFRTSDIDSVGDNKHLTFFEMLGNFSIGNYFKKEAIEWAWEFITQRLKVPVERLWATVYLDDDEAFGHWRRLGIPERRILRLGEKDNFWGPAGDSGPCGPCSELHYDLGKEVGCDRPDCDPTCDCGRYVEIWNLVFTQYNQDKDGKRTPLPRPNIDTGMGLERAAAMMQGKLSVYETDLFWPLIELVAVKYGRRYGQDEATDRALRVVVEHGRAVTFLIADGVVPSNEGRGYVLRRVLRRAAMFGRKLGLKEPFLSEVAEAVISRMGHVYPELAGHRDFVLKVIGMEEERFGQTIGVGTGVLEHTIIKMRRDLAGYLPGFHNTVVFALSGQDIIDLIGAVRAAVQQFLRDSGAWQHVLTVGGTDVIDASLKPVRQALEQMQDMVERKESESKWPPEPFETFKNRLRVQLERIEKAIEAARRISGFEAFILYDTYGFPLELTREIAREQRFTVDEAGFEAEMEKQRQRARAAQQFGLGEREAAKYEKLGLTSSKFVGYDRVLHEGARIVHLLRDGVPITSASQGQEVEVVLDETPFYAEMGGQVGDKGVIVAPHGKVRVSDTQAPRHGIIVHRGQVEYDVEVGDRVWAEVDSERRLDIARNHTATHLLQAALRQVLGKHVRQGGSLVAPERLRFDFSHLGAPTAEQLREVQRLVNGYIRADLPVKQRETDFKQAAEQGVLYLAGEIYGDKVRVMEIGQPPLSAEMCGGTHLHSTGQIGYLNIVSESSIGAGVRRIEAVTGRGAEQFIEERLAELDSLAKELQTTPAEVQGKVQALSAELETERKRSMELERQLSRQVAESLLAQAERVDGVAVVAAQVPALSREVLREMGDWLRDKLGSGVVVLGTIYDDKPNFLAMVTPDLVGKGLHAGNLVKQVAVVTGGGGGGRPELAQAGGKDKSKIEEALGLVKNLVKQR